MSKIGLIRNSTRELFKRLWSSEAGAMAVLVALAMPVLIGLVGLSMDAGGWYVKKRSLQTAADAAALAGTYALANGDAASAIYDAALTDAKANSFDETGTGVITVNTPAANGNYVGDDTTVEVELQEEAPLFFSSLFLTEPVTIYARAVAQQQVVAGNMCMLALSPDASPALQLSGSVNLQMDCGIASNSTAADAISVNGSVDVQASSLWTAGGIEEIGSVDIQADTIKTSAAAIDDPYAGLAVPSYSGCDYTNTSIKNDTTLSPGVYCGGLEVKANAVVTMEAGTYIIDGGDLSFTSSGSVTGEEVAIVMTSSSGSDYGIVSITGSGTYHLSAPTSGDMAGVVLYQDRDAPYDTSVVHGSSDVWLSGAVYFPSQNLDYGGSDDFENACVDLIALTIDFHGSIDMQNACSDQAEDDSAATAAVVKLVE